MPYLEEAQVVLVAVGYFRDLGYDYHCGSVLAPTLSAQQMARWAYSIKNGKAKRCYTACRLL